MPVTKLQFKQLLDTDEVIILDGGLATEIEAQGHALTTALWSAQLLMNNPQAIIDAHMAYLEAGAQIITTASYQASLPGLINAGLSQEQALKMILYAVKLAEQSRDGYHSRNPQSKPALIAASVGPFGAYLADGSEYTGNYDVNERQLKEFHAQRLHALDQANVDILACETIPSITEAKVLNQLLQCVHTPAWVSFSCRDGRSINDGTPVAEAAKLFADNPNVLAIGVNCTAPTYVTELIEHTKSTLNNKAVIVYPNSGEVYDAKNKTWGSVSDSTTLTELAKDWYLTGASVIGGCCRIGPAEINCLYKYFRQLN